MIEQLLGGIANRIAGQPVSLAGEIQALVATALELECYRDFPTLQPESKIDHGGEHDLWAVRKGNGWKGNLWDHARAIKATREERFGYLPDGGTAKPSDYLNRLRLANLEFKSDFEVLGVWHQENSIPKIVVSQPWISGKNAEQEKIDFYLSEFGYEKTSELGPGPMGRQQPIWEKPFGSGTLRIADTCPSNVLEDENGELVFIDVIAQMRWRGVGNSFTR